MDKKLTDSDIIKALECCPKAEMTVDCKALGCPVYQKKGCGYVLNCDLDSTTDAIIEGLSKDALDLINRQKAEIERLKTNLNVELDNFASEYDDKIKAEAYKECIEKLKKQTDCLWVGGYRFTATDLDNLYKELVGGDN